MTTENQGVTVTKKQALIVGAILFVLLAIVAGGGVAFMLTRDAGNGSAVSSPVSGSPGDLVIQYYREANTGNVDAAIAFLPPLPEGRTYNKTGVAKMLREQTRNGSVDHVELYDENEKGLIARCRYTVFFNDGAREKGTEYFTKVNGAWRFSTMEETGWQLEVDTIDPPALTGGAQS